MTNELGIGAPLVPKRSVGMSGSEVRKARPEAKRRGTSRNSNGSAKSWVSSPWLFSEYL